jgi:hypothetical protein
MVRRISRTKYLTVFATTTLIFVIGLVIGNYISNTKLKNINRLEQDLRIDTMSVEIQYMLLSENPCADIDSNILTEELYEIGNKLDYMESRLGSNNPSVLWIKEYYSLLEIRHWLFMKKIKKDCNSTNALILYFYSNKGDCEKCEEQGYVLSYIRKKHPTTRVYSFDINIDNTALDSVKDIFKIKNKELPILIINDKVYFGFKDRQDIESLI